MSSPLWVPGPIITTASDRQGCLPTYSGKHVGTEKRFRPLVCVSIRFFLFMSKGLGELLADFTALDQSCCCSRPVIRNFFSVMSTASDRRGPALALIFGGSHEKFCHSFLSNEQSSFRVFQDKKTRFSRFPLARFINR